MEEQIRSLGIASAIIHILHESWPDLFEEVSKQDFDKLDRSLPPTEALHFDRNLEQVRIRLDSAQRRYERQEQDSPAFSPQMVRFDFTRAIAELRRVQGNPIFFRIAGAITVEPTGLYYGKISYPQEYFRNLEKYSHRKISVARLQRSLRFLSENFQSVFRHDTIPLSEAVAFISDLLSEATSEIERRESDPESQLDQNGRSLARLRSVLPDQKIAPVQFEISNDRLVIVQHKSGPRKTDENHVENARSALVSIGDKILTELKNSNCDRRLIDRFERLQQEISANSNIIGIAMNNIACHAMGQTFRGELPDAVYSALSSHCYNVEMFAAQFPDWARFVENAAEVQLSVADVAKIGTTAEKLVEDLKKIPERVDPEVPVTILRLQEIVKEPRTASKRAAFAVLRTIENLVSKIFSYGLDFFEQSLKKTVSGMSSVTAKLAIVSLLTLALGGAAGVSPIASKVVEMSWLNNAASLVKSHLVKLIGE